ncbi:MAG: GGDEF domain-containing protein [Kastovskya adunca ATA6-11-RM4]|jgi:diguanylate cyclase (GGDEF)-like protein|nr:GGDEF domain-containing protein [Kastovskya adunca ATA6-11-RM4]
MTEGIGLENQESQLLAEIAQLHAEIERLKRDGHDLQVALSTTAEHGDLIEAQLYETNVKLQAEVVERQRAEAMLKALLDIISRERDDLAIILQTIREHGDAVDTQWHQKFNESTLLASSDSLTQIANRRGFDEHLNYQWQQMVREQAALAVILCDIDYFKQYNDTYGHPAGDNCLQQVARVLRAAVNRPQALVARYGGEEFAVILPQTEEAEALELAEQIQSAIAKLQIPHLGSRINPCVSVSMGVAWAIPREERSPNSLIAEADRCLYLAKQQGRNRIVHQIITE